jgi:hypothetical protein
MFPNNLKKNNHLLFSVDGGWTDWITTNSTCFQMNNSKIWGRPKYRNCSQPLPKYGGKQCSSSIGFTEYSFDPCTPGGINLLLKLGRY